MDTHRAAGPEATPLAAAQAELVAEWRSGRIDGATHNARQAALFAEYHPATTAREARIGQQQGELVAKLAHGKIGRARFQAAYGELEREHYRIAARPSGRHVRMRMARALPRRARSTLRNRRSRCRRVRRTCSNSPPGDSSGEDGPGEPGAGAQRHTHVGQYRTAGVVV
jgi:hypothetical protein